MGGGWLWVKFSFKRVDFVLPLSQEQEQQEEPPPKKKQLQLNKEFDSSAAHLWLLSVLG